MKLTTTPRFELGAVITTFSDNMPLKPILAKKPELTAEYLAKLFTKHGNKEPVWSSHHYNHYMKMKKGENNPETTIKFCLTDKNEYNKYLK